jgi:hypothetical protein
MSEWVSGTELMARWEIRNFELLGYVCKGLQPYHPEIAQPIPSPKVEFKKWLLFQHQEEIRRLKNKCRRFSADWYETPKDFDKEAMENDIESLQSEVDMLADEISKAGFSWKGYDPSEPSFEPNEYGDVSELKDIIAKLAGYIFNLDEVKNFEDICQEDGRGCLPYLDTNNEFFSEELQIAVKAWEALFHKSAINLKKGYKKQILNWLDQNHHHLSNAAKERIATLINPKKEGGAPPSGTY